MCVYVRTHTLAGKAVDKDVPHYVVSNLRVLLIFMITLLQGLALEMLKNIC